MLASHFWEYIFGMPQLPIILGCLIPIVAIVCGFAYKSQKARSDNELKRVLAERGMSADEIVRVIEAHRRCE
jgi:hypothetical protein